VTRAAIPPSSPLFPVVSARETAERRHFANIREAIELYLEPIDDDPGDFSGTTSRSSTSRYEQGPQSGYDRVVRALQRDGWVSRATARESHIRMQKRLAAETLKLTVPAHRPIKKSTLAHLL
jgi:predicted RNA binding protein YcfA (HicA-like mRNA interferase family)